MVLRTLIALAALATFGSSVTCLAADRTNQASRESIPFSSTGGIDEWHADGDKALFLRSRSGQWYRAELVTPCMGLGFATSIGYIAESDGSFDSSSAILVDGLRCQLSKLEKTEKPPARKQ